MTNLQIIVDILCDFHRIETIKKNALPFEYIWMDAGWYGIDTKPTPDEYEGDWGCHTGDWRVSPLVHSQGLKACFSSGFNDCSNFINKFKRVTNETPSEFKKHLW